MSQEFSQALLVIVGVLFGTVSFFLKRSVDRLDSIAQRLAHVESEQRKQGGDINGIGGQLREVKADVRQQNSDVRKIELSVAELKGRLTFAEKPA